MYMYTCDTESGVDVSSLWACPLWDCQYEKNVPIFNTYFTHVNEGQKFLEA